MGTFVTGVVALTTLLIVSIFVEGDAYAATRDLTPAINVLKSHGFNPVTTDFNASVISLSEGPAVNTAYSWARAAQLEGLAVLVPIGIIAEHKMGHPNTVIAIDPMWVAPATENGFFALLPKLD